MSSKDETDKLINTLISQVQSTFAILADQPSINNQISKPEIQRNVISPSLPQWQMTGMPILAGSQFVIARSWDRDLLADNPIYANRKLLKIDPGIAFGFGHNTTLACIEALEQYWKGGRLLDIGTGTGVLAMVSAYLCPEAIIEAFDISLEVVEHANTHFKINGFDNKISLRQGSIEDYKEQKYDCVVGNLLPGIIKRS